jgi:hypothetical protein
LSHGIASSARTLLFVCLSPKKTLQTRLVPAFFVSFDGARYILSSLPPFATATMEPTQQTSTTSTRAFSTTARIGMTPMAPRRPLPLKWVAPATALLCAGFAAHTIRQYLADSRQSAAAMDAEFEMARRRREQAIMDMYGDRTSLADLERASTMYAAKKATESKNNKH